MSQVWAAGVWADGVWADGVWEEAVGGDPGSPLTPASGGLLRRHRRIIRMRSRGVLREEVARERG